MTARGPPREEEKPSGRGQVRAHAAKPRPAPTGRARGGAASCPGPNPRASSGPPTSGACAARSAGEAKGRSRAGRVRALLAASLDPGAARVHAEERAPAGGEGVAAGLRAPGAALTAPGTAARGGSRAPATCYTPGRPGSRVVRCAAPASVLPAFLQRPSLQVSLAEQGGAGSRLP